MNLIEFKKYRDSLQTKGVIDQQGDATLLVTSMGAVEQPTVKVSKRYDWVEYGDDNLYPSFLLDLYNGSAIHGAIVSGTATMVAGGELLVNGADAEGNEAAIAALSADARGAYDAFVSNGVGDDDIYAVKDKAALDYMIFGAFALEVLWSRDKTRVAEVRHVDVSKVRLGKIVDGVITKYYYSDWSDKKAEKREFDAFDESKPGGSQLLYVRNHNPGQDYYGRPRYTQGLTWISTDVNLGSYHNTNVTNGFNPSLRINFFDVPDDPDKRRRIVSGIHAQFQGVKNTGKAMVMFSQDKDHAPIVEPIQVSNLDKQYIALAEQCVQQIMSTHRVTHPLLFGVQVPGKLGGSGELEAAFVIYDSTVVAPERAKLERTLNRLLSVNTQEVLIQLEVFNPLA